ncbi:hypothetical protein GP486_005017 [Trichoglossum hirsutum]|uniref:CHAT domain-containing protein n=1 Tax=Trichoglossum hirsutum TaxID=265104 RepID=A0A9P8L9Z9_9PEZI|nr:hypothetical protein GP486_005017 [Trichoglossum hirsutum]
MGKIEDLEEAIRVVQQAVDITPKDHTNLTGSLNNLGIELDNRYECTGKIEDLEEATRIAQQAVNITTKDHPDLATQLNSLGIKHNRSLDYQDQQYIVSHFSGLATTACPLALQTGQGPEASSEALDLLMNDRSDTSELKVAYPQLYAQYESLRLEVNKPTKNIPDDHTRKTAPMSWIEATTKFEKCVRDIQQLPGFSQLHKGLTAKQMQNCSTEGSIVVVNVTDLRSDAIIITADAFKQPRSQKQAYLQFLSWLWHECVRPVLDELHYRGEPSAEDLPKVWWTGTGLASLFPFHSAGDISVGPTGNATPTLKAHQYAQDRTGTSIPSYLPSRCDPRETLIVTMPKTPGTSNLPGTRAERSEIIAAMGSSVSVKTLEYSDVVSTMAQLQECDIAHFACHGVSDPVDPPRSGLILQTADEKPRQDILSVREAEIAYLSACSTAQNQATRLLDEVLHVVSGFQVAGFRHVVGCLWPYDDKVCVEIAMSFYSELSGGGTYDDRAIALALHKAVVKNTAGGRCSRRSTCISGHNLENILLASR